VRDLSSLGLREATHAVADGRVLLGGAPYAWEADDMVAWLSSHDAQDGPAVAAERERARFTLAPAA
jgi:hypothetical protein